MSAIAGTKVQASFPFAIFFTGLVGAAMSAVLLRGFGLLAGLGLLRRLGRDGRLVLRREWAATDVDGVLLEQRVATLDGLEVLGRDGQLVAGVVLLDADELGHGHSLVAANVRDEVMPTTPCASGSR